MATETQSTGILTREQLCQLFDRFTFLTSQPDVKKRIAEAVRDKQIRDLVFHAWEKEEMACDEAELGEEEFAEKMYNQQKLQEQQLEMLRYMRKFHLDDQSAILEKLHQQMENGNYESETSILSAEQIEEIVPRKLSPLYTPS